MGRLYSAVGDATPATADSLLTLQAATTIKPELLDIVVGCPGTPADGASLFDLYRFTVDDGTGDATTANPLDPGDPASLASCLSNHSAEPNTIGATMLSIPLHQRATFRWVAAPGRGFKILALATVGLGLRFLTTTISSPDHHCTFIWEE